MNIGDIVVELSAFQVGNDVACTRWRCLGMQVAGTQECYTVGHPTPVVKVQ
jgi:hypothetical protein